MPKRKSGPVPNSGDRDPLDSFLACVDRYAQTISAQIVATAPEGEQRLIMEATAVSYVAQTRKLTDFVREASVGITQGTRRELEQFLRVQDSEAMVDRAVEVSATVVASGGVAKMGFLSWLDENLKTLKKIITEILQLIFGDNLPGWVNTVMLIIDELFNLLKTLFGGASGLRMDQVADALSREEVNFLHEMTALTELQNAMRGGRMAARRSGRNGDDEMKG
jgi:hypothetical protein